MPVNNYFEFKMSELSMDYTDDYNRMTYIIFAPRLACQFFQQLLPTSKDV